MIRLLAAVLIAVSFAIAGFVPGQIQADRVVYLRNLLRSLTLMESRIRFGAIPVTELLDLAANASDLETFLKECAADMQRGMDLPSAWKSAVLADHQLRRLTAIRIELLAFGRVLGTTDTQGQLDHCSQTAEVMKEELQRQLAEKIKVSRLFPPLGFLLGAAVALMIV